MCATCKRELMRDLGKILIIITTTNKATNSRSLPSPVYTDVFTCIVGPGLCAEKRQKNAGKKWAKKKKNFKIIITQRKPMINYVYFVLMNFKNRHRTYGEFNKIS